MLPNHLAAAKPQRELRLRDPPEGRPCGSGRQPGGLRCCCDQQPRPDGWWSEQQPIYNLRTAHPQPTGCPFSDPPEGRPCGFFLQLRGLWCWCGQQASPGGWRPEQQPIYNLRTSHAQPTGYPFSDPPEGRPCGFIPQPRGSRCCCGQQARLGGWWSEQQSIYNLRTAHAQPTDNLPDVQSSAHNPANLATSTPRAYTRGARHGRIYHSPTSFAEVDPIHATAQLCARGDGEGCDPKRR